MRVMRATTIHAPRDIRLEERPDPTIEAPTDAIVKVTAGCICGSDLWPYRGENDITPGDTIGHEMIGVIEEVGSEVTSFAPGDFVVAPFCHCDNTCAHCQAGAHSACVNLGFTLSGQSEYAKVNQADGSLVKTDGMPQASLLPSLLTLADVFPTGWHCAMSADVKPGDTVVVVGDGAVGLCGVLAAAEMGAERVIAMSRHEQRQEIARQFGATHIVAERGKEGAERVKDLTDGVGADAVLECVGTDSSMKQAFASARPGSTVGFVGAPHGVELPVRRMFGKNIGLAGGVAPVRRYLPELLELVTSGTVDPGIVFDLTLPLEKVAEGYRAMDERTAIKTYLEIS
jgi:threonine dehydrogenase-like Zn-dependent dehydrogenase